MDLGRSGLLSRVSLVRSGSSGFGEENLPSDPPKSVFGGEDPPPIVTGIGLASFRVNSGGLGKWVGFLFPVDSPTSSTWPVCSFFLHIFLGLKRLTHAICFLLQIPRDFARYFLSYGCYGVEISSKFGKKLASIGFVVVNQACYLLCCGSSWSSIDKK